MSSSYSSDPPMDEKALKGLIAKANSRHSPQLQRQCLRSLISSISSASSPAQLKIFACSQVRLFIGNQGMDDLVEEGINAVYDVCEDQERDVRVKGYEILVGVSKVRGELVKRNVDVLIQLLQSEDAVELKQIALSLRNHLNLDLLATLEVISEQLLPSPASDREYESHLRVLVLKWLLDAQTLDILLSHKSLTEDWSHVLFKTLPGIKDHPALVADVLRDMVARIPPYTTNRSLLISDLLALSSEHSSLLQPILSLLPSLSPSALELSRSYLDSSFLTTKDFLLSGQTTMQRERERLIVVTSLSDCLASVMQAGGGTHQVRMNFAERENWIISALLNSRKSNTPTLNLDLDKAVRILIENLNWALTLGSWIPPPKPPQHPRRPSLHTPPPPDLHPVLERLSSSPEGRKLDSQIKKVQSVLLELSSTASSSITTARTTPATAIRKTIPPPVPAPQQSQQQSPPVRLKRPLPTKPSSATTAPTNTTPTNPNSYTNRNNHTAGIPTKRPRLEASPPGQRPQARQSGAGADSGPGSGSLLNRLTPTSPAGELSIKGSAQNQQPQQQGGEGEGHRDGLSLSIKGAASRSHPQPRDGGSGGGGGVGGRMKRGGNTGSLLGRLR